MAFFNGIKSPWDYLGMGGAFAVATAMGIPPKQVLSEQGLPFWKDYFIVQSSVFCGRKLKLKGTLLWLSNFCLWKIMHEWYRLNFAQVMVSHTIGLRIYIV